MNLTLYSNQIMPDHCVVHGCSNRSDMNAGISAYFSPTIKMSETSGRDCAYSPRKLQPKFVAGVSPFHGQGGMFFKSVSYGRLLLSV